MMIFDELLLDLGPASSGDAGPLVSDGTRKKKKRPLKTESVGSETRIHTGVQATVVAIHQAVPQLRCAVCSYEGHTELELDIHYVHQHCHGDAGPRKGQRRSAISRSAAVARDVVDLTAGPATWPRRRSSTSTYSRPTTILCATSSLRTTSMTPVRRPAPTM